MRCLRCGLPSGGRRACAALGAPRAGVCECVGPSRSDSRVGKCDCHGGCVRQLAGEILWSDKTEPEGGLQAGDRLRRVTAFGASDDVRGRGGSKAQPAPCAAKVGHGRDHRFFPGRPCPHAGQARFIAGSNDRSSPSSKYTRWRPRPETRRACPHSGQKCVVLGAAVPEGAGRCGDAISVAISPPPRC
jgi:hypothetical protein